MFHLSVTFFAYKFIIVIYRPILICSYSENEDSFFLFLLREMYLLACYWKQSIVHNSFTVMKDLKAIQNHCSVAFTDITIWSIKQMQVLVLQYSG